MLRIGCELSAISRNRAGISVFTRNLLEHLCRIPGQQWLGYLHDGPDPGIPAMTLRRGRGWLGRLAPLWIQAAGRRHILSDRLDIYWTPLYRVPLGLAGRVPIVVTVHDLMWKVLPETMRLRTRLLNVMSAGHAIRVATRIVADSEATAQDVERYYGVARTRIDVVYGGVSSRFHPIALEEACRRVKNEYGIDRPYCLAVSTVEPRKNLARVMDALRSCPTAPPLIVVGAKGWKTSAIMDKAQALPLGRVRFLGYVPEEDLPCLYSAAEFFLYPSLYEGFGFPVAEAMACGCPVLTSNISSLPEVAADAGLLVDPLSEQAIVEGIRRLTQDGGLRSRLRTSGLQQVRRFTWEKSAQEYLEIFRRTAGTRSRILPLRR